MGVADHLPLDLEKRNLRVLILVVASVERECEIHLQPW